jgi:hypothetical protein
MDLKPQKPRKARWSRWDWMLLAAVVAALVACEITFEQYPSDAPAPAAARRP